MLSGYSTVSGRGATRLRRVLIPSAGRLSNLDAVDNRRKLLGPRCKRISRQLYGRLYLLADSREVSWRWSSFKGVNPEGER